MHEWVPNGLPAIMGTHIAGVIYENLRNRSMGLTGH